MASISALQAALKEKLELNGPLAIEEVQEWLLSEGLQDKEIGQVINPGMGRRKWWFKRDGYIVPTSWTTPPVIGEEDGTGHEGGSPTSNGPEEVYHLTDLRDQMRELAQSLGIGKEKAAATANFLGDTVNVYDGEALWNALRHSEFSPNQRIRFYLAWANKMGIKPTPEIARVLSKVSSLDMSKPLESESGKGRYAPGRYMVVDGEPIPVDHDDPGGVSLTEAVRIAQLQNERTERRQSRDPGPVADQSLAATLIHEHGETERTRLQTSTMGRDEESGSSKMFMALLESQRRESDIKMESIRRETDAKQDMVRQEMRSTMDLFREQLTNTMEKLTTTLQGLGTRMQEKPNTFGVLDSIAPGLGQRLIEKLLDPPKNDALVLKLGENGEITPGHIAMLEQLEGIKARREGMTLLREYVPEFLSTWKDFSEAIKEEKASRASDTSSDSSEIPQEEEMLLETKCIGCGIDRLQYSSSQSMFQCAKCGTIQTPDGDLVEMTVHKRVKITEEPKHPTPEESIIPMGKIEETPLSAPEEHPSTKEAVSAGSS